MTPDHPQAPEAQTVTNEEQDGQVENRRWAVTVEAEGESVLTLAWNHLSGRDLSGADVEMIRMCAHQLLAFIGDPSPLADLSGESRRRDDDPSVPIVMGSYRTLRSGRRPTCS